MNILFSFFYLLHHLNFSSPFQRFLKIFNDYIFSHTWQTKAIIDHSKEASTLTHYQVFLNFIHISASPWLSRTDPCFPFLSARGLATVWKLTTGEKGLQPNLFCDLGMVTMVIMSPWLSWGVTWPSARTPCCYPDPWWCTSAPPQC